MTRLLAWPLIGSALGGIGTLFLLSQLRPHRGKPGANWFLLSLGGGAVWCLGYAAALLVVDPTLRLALEMVVWLGMITAGITFLGFALVYTGRGRLIHSWWYRLFVATTAGVGLLVVTNPLHELVWRDFAVDPVLGVATVSYGFQPVAYVTIVGGILAILTGSLVLFETVISYGRLYRSEAIAVGLSTVPPAAGLVAWVSGIGPYPELNLAPVLFLPHVALDTYAFVGSDMFEFYPATRRTGERAAIRDLGSPVLIVDDAGRLVTFNEAAGDVFDLADPEDVTYPLGSILEGDDVDPAAGETTVTIDTTDGRRQFSVTPAELVDDTGTPVGYTIVFQDVTDERRRKQRLGVLNRILRHNLRNDMMVIRMSLQQAADGATEEDLASAADRGLRKADSLVETGEKARAIEQALESADTGPHRVELAVLLSTVAADLREAHPEATVELAVAEDITLETNPELLRLVLANLVENGVVHDDGDPRVTVTATYSSGGTRIEVADSGPGVPDHELSVIRRGEETDLSHGSGLGLWIVHWGVRTVGGSVEFSVDDEGTTATVWLPPN